MREVITPQVSARICKHMNEDHGDALILYAQYFGKLDNFKTAKMLSIDNQAMYLSIDGNDAQPLRIEFDHTLEDAKDAHHTLVEMLKEARKNLQNGGVGRD